MAANDYIKNRITADEVRNLLDYDPETGEFRWKVRRNNRTAAGSRAGAIDVQGYWVINTLGFTYKAHRLAWLIVYGAWPEGEIDHIDHCRSNNKLSNLRLVTFKENHRNKSLRKVNTSGVCGVNRHAGKWQCRIVLANGKRVSLGHFDNLEDAKTARLIAERADGFHPNHGT